MDWQAKSRAAAEEKAEQMLQEAQERERKEAQNNTRYFNRLIYVLSALGVDTDADYVRMDWVGEYPALYVDGWLFWLREYGNRRHASGTWYELSVWTEEIRSTMKEIAEDEKETYWNIPMNWRANIEFTAYLDGDGKAHQDTLVNFITAVDNVEQRSFELPDNLAEYGAKQIQIQERRKRANEQRAEATPRTVEESLELLTQAYLDYLANVHGL